MFILKLFYFKCNISVINCFNPSVESSEGDAVESRAELVGRARTSLYRGQYLTLDLGDRIVFAKHNDIVGY